MHYKVKKTFFDTNLENKPQGAQEPPCLGTSTGKLHSSPTF